MISILDDLITKIYRNKGYDFFVTKCKEKLSLPNELDDFIKQRGYRLIQTFDNQYPSIRWYCYFNDFEKGEFKVTYKTVIDISKIAPLFYVQHEFEVENKDLDRISPVLDGFDSQPYTQQQASLYEMIASALDKSGYRELSYREMNEVVEDIKMPKDVSIFGPQITVEHLFFYDVLDLCQRD